MECCLTLLSCYFPVARAGEIMSRNIFAGLAALAVLCCASAAQAGEAQSNEQIALFQTRNIFHSGLRGTHTVALTFDDGPNKDTLAVLDVLKKEGVKGTFFIVGRMGKRYPEILTRIAREGHLLANHSASHPLLSSRFDKHPSRLLSQIRQVDDEIAPLMPTSAKFYFRAPYGSWRRAHAAILNDDPVLRKYVGPIYWDIGGETRLNRNGYIMSSADWNCWHRGWNARTCAKGYLRETRRHNGGIILMHCIHTRSAALVAAIIPVLKQEGYRFVRLDDVPAYRKYETPTVPAQPAVASVDAGIAMAVR